MARVSITGILNNTIRGIKSITKIFGEHKTTKDEKISETTPVINYINNRRRDDRRIICNTYVNVVICYEIGPEGIIKVL